MYCIVSYSSNYVFPGQHGLLTTSYFSVLHCLNIPLIVCFQVKLACRRPPTSVYCIISCSSNCVFPGQVHGLSMTSYFSALHCLNIPLTVCFQVNMACRRPPTSVYCIVSYSSNCVFPGQHSLSTTSYFSVLHCLIFL